MTQYSTAACGSLNLVKYQAKPTKTVVDLSTLHKGAACQTDGKKPESVLYYNENKCRVDMLDFMCRQMSTRSGCRRWPLAVFWNTASINAWILFRKTTNAQISRRQFLGQLSAELRETSTSSASTPAPASTSSSSTTTQLGKSQMSSESGVQTQQNVHTVWQLQETSLWPVYGEHLQAVQRLEYVLQWQHTVSRQLTLAAVLGINTPTGLMA